jgi:hypothetical protein
MISFYAKTLAACRQLGLVVLLIGAITSAQAQQKTPTGNNSPKMSANDPLLKIGLELAALQSDRNTARTNLRTQLPERTFRKKSLLQIQGDYVAIEAVAEPNQTAQLLAELTRLGMTKSASYGRMVSGLMPINQLHQVAALKNLHFARPAYEPRHNIGEVTSQGDRAMYADSVRKKQAVKGRGSKIGVLSDSYNSRNGAEKGIKSGDLPGTGNPNGYTTPIQVLRDYISEGNIDEGRAMLEIIHDVAPAAELAFHTAFLGQANFAQGILDLQKAGCNIITDDVFYYAEPMFQDGIIAQAVDEVVKKDVAYFTAVGNADRKSYQAKFKNSGRSVVVNGQNYGVAHDFGNGDITQTIRIPANGLLLIPTQWDDPFFSVSGLPGAQTDLDILVFYQGRLLTDLSSFEKNIGNDPIEILGIVTDSTGSADLEIAIVKYSGPDPGIIKWINFGNAFPLEHDTKSPSVFGHSNAAGAVSTGAVFFGDTPAYGIPEPVAENFSTAGGTPILFDVNGNRKKEEIRQKPEVMAPDGVNTTFFYQLFNGRYYFFGTSAAAPHAAAVAALMQESSGNSLSPARIKTVMQKTALDMNQPGFDFDTGYGLINAFKAVEEVAKPRVQYFTLVNATTGKNIQTINEGDTINLTRLPTRQVLIRAHTGPARVGSVVMKLNSKEVTENIPPYDYPGTENIMIRLDEDDYTITATPYTKPGGQGETGIPLTVHFKAVEEKIARFELIDVAQNKVIKTLRTGDFLYLPDLPGKLNIRAITAPGKVGSVQFSLNDKKTTENLPPYDLAGSSDGNIDFTAGLYTLSATTYPRTRARGSAGGTETIIFAAVNLSEEEAALADKLPGKTNGGLAISPNPFAGRAKISFTVPETGNALLTIYDLNGTPVKTIHNGPAEAGKQYEYTLDGSSLPAGWYIGRVVTNKATYHQKLRLTK